MSEPATRREPDSLTDAAYKELHRLAASVKYSSPPSPVSPSTLVNETWLRFKERTPELNSHLDFHLKCAVAQAMRRILVDEARKRKALKRGGDAPFITFDESLHITSNDHLIALNDALDKLALADAEQAKLVELRFFGGLDYAEMAILLGVSETTVKRHWRAAKAWLAAQLQPERGNFAS